MPSKKRMRRYLLQSLNLFGLDYLDAVILAALTDEKPLLLIGGHGTAKSELLNRVAIALSLEHRHYNASLISFDDLIGYPVPNAERTQLEYLHTPGDIWSAESVFLDEISRCKPEHQNRLFSIIHERRIQGLPLTNLRYRWSAMNPAPVRDDIDYEDEQALYCGSLPLDAALADRFPYVVKIPTLEQFSVEDRLRIINEGGDFHRTGLVEEMLAETKAVLAGCTSDERQWAARYVNALVIPLKQAGLAISGRRAVSLSQTILSLHAANQVLATRVNLDRSALDALRHGLPQVAQGVKVRESLIKTIHKGAIQEANNPTGGIWQVIRNELDPIKRVQMALGANSDECGRLQFSQLVNDAWASLTRPRQYLFARNFLPALTEDRLTVNTLEILLEPLSRVEQFASTESHNFSQSRVRAGDWDQLQKVILKLKNSGTANQIDLGNLLYTIYWVENEQFDAAALVRLDTRWGRLFGSAKSLGKAA